MKRPACIKCSQTYRTKRIGVDCLEIDDDNEPVGVWHADILECPSCHNEILWGFGADAIFKPWDKDSHHFALKAEHRFRS